MGPTVSVWLKIEPYFQLVVVPISIFCFHCFLKIMKVNFILFCLLKNILCCFKNIRLFPNQTRWPRKNFNTNGLLFKFNRPWICRVEQSVVFGYYHHVWASQLIVRNCEISCARNMVRCLTIKSSRWCFPTMIILLLFVHFSFSLFSFMLQVQKCCFVIN